MNLRKSIWYPDGGAAAKYNLATAFVKQGIYQETTDWG